jgi:serine/threonine protein kinase
MCARWDMMLFITLGTCIGTSSHCKCVGVCMYPILRIASYPIAHVHTYVRAYIHIHSRQGCRLQNVYEYNSLYTHTHAHTHTHIQTYSNVFVDKNMVAKVADFGMCTSMTHCTDGCGTIQWAAPEVLMNIFGRQQQYDKRCDVYRYVCVCMYVFVVLVT